PASPRAHLEIVRPLALPFAHDAASAHDAPATSASSLPTLPDATPGGLAPMNLANLLRDIEATYIDAALAQTHGNRQAAATLLGMQRTTLVEKLRRRSNAAASSSSPASVSSSSSSSSAAAAAE